MTRSEKQQLLRKDPTDFRNRFQAWKSGVPAYEDGKPLSFGDKLTKDIFRTMLPFAIGGGLWGQSNKYKNGKDLPRLKDGKRYISNGNGGWDRISDDIMADQFANLVITPNKNRIIESRKIDPYQEHIRQSVKNAGYVTDQLIEDDQRARSAVALQGKGELPLERVYPEFDLFAISPLLKDGIMYGSKKVADRLGFFVQKPGTYTRGIGMTDAGVQDAVKTGVFRGNPRGTEQTAKHFDKMFLRNRNNFRDIVRDTNIKGIESRYQSRTLTEEDFNALKEASKKYTRDEMSVDGNTITLRRGSSDPLSDYKNYQEYMDDINATIARTEQMRNRVASGEVQVNNQLSEPMWFEDESGKMFLPQGRPITERFGTNSDYVSDGNPLQYWYADGRNAITKGHPYARSNYMVRVNNPQDYIPFMHELHKHPSFFKTPKLSDPNVELFRRGPFGITIRMRKPIKYRE